MQDRRRRLRAYRKSRRKFSCIVYTITTVWMVLALIQWLAVCFVIEFRETINLYYWISFVCFICAMIFFTMFIFFEGLRFVICLNWLICILIVESLIIGLFALSAQTDWKNLLIWFLVCVTFIYLFILIGSVLPQDLTLNVVILFVVAFLFLSVTVFMSMMHKIMHVPYSFYAYMILIGLIVLMVFHKIESPPSPSTTTYIDNYDGNGYEDDDIDEPAPVENPTRKPQTTDSRTIAQPKSTTKRRRKKKTTVPVIWG
ncbi:uncharacterized protein LOC111081838 isoform X2 [Drosophila obscura]|uniref:uncharacterized protein LOC111081838 isoform X2 n=1 Tax=Drosophila obscura TaxID=7282 RepID=UPI000B9FC877|nr:uncharacterized protein LOC111081838 isoform X2 [Drosophila obscura]